MTPFARSFTGLGESYDQRVLFGRESERERLSGLLHRMRRGESGSLVIRGEAGVGKSTLLDDLRLQAPDMRVLRGSGIESEAQVAYATLHQIIRPVLDNVDRLPTPQARALQGALGLEIGTSDEWFLVALGVLSLLDEAAEEQPVLILVDDAQWLDDASAETLVFVARRLGAEPIGIVFAAREGDVRAFKAPGVTELMLSGLEPAAADALLSEHLGSTVSPEARERLVEGTGGNPLALLELAPSQSDAPVGDTTPLPVSARIENAYLANVRGLPDQTQTLLLAAACEDRGDFATVLGAARLLDISPSALDPAERIQLVSVDESRLEFRHPLVRSAVYQAAPFSQRQSVHRALADVLASEADADRRAWHRAAASVGPDESVADELEQAAARARQRSGFIPAALALERAAGLAVTDEQRLRLLTSAVECAWFGGRLEQALTLLDRARPLAPGPAERAQLDRWRALVEVNAGVPALACDLFVTAATDLAPTDRDTALYMLAIGTVAGGYAGESDRVGEIGQLAAGIDGADTPVSDYLNAFIEGMAAYFGGSFESAASRLGDALELVDAADAVGSTRYRGLTILAGGAGLFLGADTQTQRIHHRLVNATRSDGALALLTQAVPRLALGEVAAGHWRTADAGLLETLELARHTGQHQVVGHILAVRALVAALCGDEAGCHALADECRELAAELSLAHVDDTARWALIDLELAAGRADAAVVHVRELRVQPVMLWSTLDRVEAAVRVGDTELAVTCLAPFEELARYTDEPWALAVTNHCRALLTDDAADAEHLFESALELHRSTVRPFERARTELALGEFLRRSRRRVDAREHLRAALEGFESLGAALWAERATSELRASGQTARRREPSSADDLTPQELQVARYVARGLNNRDVAAQLFLSPRTIDFHLRNVFRKLGITSRMQLPLLELDDDAVQPAVPPVRG